MSQHIETVLSFGPAEAPLVGILAQPADAPIRQAMIIIVGGPQYRVGSHRQFTLLARRLAGEGMAVLRFDCSGMGDSQGPKRDFTAIQTDVKAAIDALQERLPDMQEVALWGLCDGASAALLYMDETRDSRVRGLCLINPWVRSEQTFARTQVKHYYAQRLRQADFWKKLLSGRVALSALGESIGRLKELLSSDTAPRTALSFQQRMARAWRAFPGQVLLLLSGDDLVAKEFLDNAKSNADWSGILDRPGQETHHMPEADHTCSNAAARRHVENLVRDWLHFQISHA